MALPRLALTHRCASCAGVAACHAAGSLMGLNDHMPAFGPQMEGSWTAPARRPGSQAGPVSLSQLRGQAAQHDGQRPSERTLSIHPPFGRQLGPGRAGAAVGGLGARALERGLDVLGRR